MKITLSAGGGGKAMNELLSGLILKHFKNKELHEMRDASYIECPEKAVFSTDSFVVTPEFFPGGDIGKLAVAGTTNDLACSGATPLYLSCGLVIPEGYDRDDLDKILGSMAEAAAYAGVEIVTGDTKVVPRGDLRGLMINTAGIGRLENRWNDYPNVKVGDRVIITSDIARHGVAVFLAREELGFSGSIESDCNVLCKMLKDIQGEDVHFVRDATRGGVAAVLNELADHTGLGFMLNEGDIPLRQDVAHFCDTLGFDPLAVANEGALVIIAGAESAERIVNTIKEHSAGKAAAVCGIVTDKKGVTLETNIGGKRYVEMPLGEILPRIC
ncbi:MAG: hydrogenase expression/formation protein HypE [Deferribacteraceae bacterium]|jgi:hydrogenase expression/formation protein HypE|nr:hydrogenase expression/formation protein HypE [Deferribacteraceae bacterium]